MYMYMYMYIHAYSSEHVETHTYYIKDACTFKKLNSLERDLEAVISSLMVAIKYSWLMRLLLAVLKITYMMNGQCIIHVHVHVHAYCTHV